MSTALIAPHGNTLVNRVLSQAAAEDVRQRAGAMVQIRLDEERIKDVKNIARGVLSPLTGFMNEADFTRVVDDMQLVDGTVWSLPVVLDVDKTVADSVRSGDQAALMDQAGNLVAVLHVADIYTYDVEYVAKQVFGTTDREHPGVAYWESMGNYLLGGLVDLVDNSKEPYNHVNLDPRETRFLFEQRGWKTVAGFQTRNVPHRAHEYLQRCALELTDGLFINPIIGKKKAGDFRDEVIIAAYTHMIAEYFPANSATFSILPARMNYAGPREAILHAIIRKNFGCTHFVVGRDHAGVGDYYGSYDAQKIFDTIPDIGIQILRFENSFMCDKCETMATDKTCRHSDEFRTPPSGTKIRNLITAKEAVPSKMMRPDVVAMLLKEDTPFVE